MIRSRRSRIKKRCKILACLFLLDRLIAGSARCTKVEMLALNLLNSLKNIAQPLPIIPHNGTASLSTRSRMRARRPRSVTTST